MFTDEPEFSTPDILALILKVFLGKLIKQCSVQVQYVLYYVIVNSCAHLFDSLSKETKTEIIETNRLTKLYDL